MKRITILLLCIAVLLTACQSPPTEEASPSAGPTAPEPPSSAAQPSPNPPAAEEEPSGPADYYDVIFDTSQDEGKLTARYLRITEDHKVTNDLITTGDATVFTSPEGLVMLVDCSNQSGGWEVVSQLKALNIETIDILVLSHPHADHIGGFTAIADSFAIKQIYMNSHEYDSNTYRDMMDRIRADAIPYEYLFDGDRFALGDQVDIRVFHPLETATEQVAAGYMDANNCSLGMRVTFGDSSFWTGGDLYATGEKELTDRHGDAIRSDVMKMNHHGWDTSNSKEFVETVSPLIAVAMHDSITSKTVAMRFSTRGILTFYNCADGAIKVSTAGDGSYEVQSQFIRDIMFYGEPSADGHYLVGGG